MSGERRRFSAALKAKVAIEAPKGQWTVAELEGQYQVHPSQITAWKKQFLEADQAELSRRRAADRQEHDE